jgi:hypothetical protein
MTAYEHEYTLTDRPNGDFTRYLLVHPDGAHVVNVHVAIDHHEGCLDCRGVYLITSEGYVISAHIEDLQPGWDGAGYKQRGYEFQITEWQESRDGELLEYILYVDDDRDKTDVNNVYVKGFPEQ